MSVGLPQQPPEPPGDPGKKAAFSMAAAVFGMAMAGPLGVLLGTVPYLVSDDESPPPDPLRTGWRGRKLRKLERQLLELEARTKISDLERQVREAAPADRQRQIQDAMAALERSRKEIARWPVDDATKEHALAAAEVRFRQRVIEWM